MKPLAATLVATSQGRARRTALSDSEKRALQCVVGVLAAIPVLAGIEGIVSGPEFLGVGQPWPADLDSHFRFLSGIFLAMGIAWYSCIPAIEANASALPAARGADICRRPCAALLARHRRPAVARTSRRARHGIDRGAFAGPVASAGRAASWCCRGRSWIRWLIPASVPNTRISMAKSLRCAYIGFDDLRFSTGDTFPRGLIDP